MKGLMAKFKGMGFKQILLNHAEKFILGSVGLFVLFALASTTWSGIDKDPNVLFENASKAGQALNTGAWPDEEKAKFVDSTYTDVMVAMSTKLTDENGRVSPMFAYDKPLTFPLYPRIEPKSETVWPAVGMMIADYGQMIIATTPPQPLVDEMSEEEGAEGTVAANPRIPRNPMGPMNPMGAMGPMNPMGAGRGKGAAGGSMTSEGMVRQPPGSGSSAGGAMTSAGMMSSGMMTGGAETGMGSGIKPRGTDYVAVRGIVDLDQFHKAIREAMRLDQIDEARGYLEFLDVKVQRQKAVAGANPWLEDNWVDLDIEKANEIFAECELAQDIVRFELTEQVITMPLPARLDKDYTDIVSHPFIKNYQLTKEQREQQEKIIRQLQEEAGGLNSEEKPRRRGFSGITQDVRGMQQSVMSTTGGDMSGIYQRAGVGGAPTSAGSGRMMPGQQMTLLPPTSAGGMGMTSAGMGMMPGSGMMGQKMGSGAGRPGMGQGANSEVGKDAVGRLYLFRYLDFDVNPGEAYRYRVQLLVANPNFEESLDRVREPSVSEGDSRETPWSEPTAPVVVQQHTNIFLTKLDERVRSRGEAEIKVFQRDSILGTYIDSEVHVKAGQFVGGLAESDRLDLGTPTLGKKTVLFATKEFLVDTSIPTKIIPTDHPDLKLTVDKRQEATPTGMGIAAEALVMNEYGEVHLLDNSDLSRSELGQVSKTVTAERKDWEYLRDSEKAASTNRLDAAGDGMEGMMMGPMMATGTSSTKKGGKRGGYPGSGGQTSMGGMSGGAGGAGARRGGRGGSGGARTSMDALSPMGSGSGKKPGR